MHQDVTWYGGRPQPKGLCVRWGPSSLHKKGRSPQFSAKVYCGQTAAWIKMPLGMEVGLGLHYIGLDGDPTPCPLKGHSPFQFSANVHCGQTTGWTKMPLGMEVGLGPGDFVLDGDPATPEKRHTTPTQFLAHVYCGQTAGWICHLVLGKPRSMRRCLVAPPPF